MKKAEVLKYCAEKAEEGYLTHLMILEIYNDDEEIPDEVVGLVCHPPEPPKQIIIFGSAEYIKNLNRTVEDFYRYLAQIQIKDEMVDKICKS